MAKFYRYMCREELRKVLDGETLTNHKDHSLYGRHTGARGFCFLEEHTRAEDRKGNTTFYNPVEASRFLSGVASMECLVEFETDPDSLRATAGIYADPQRDPEPEDATIADLMRMIIDTAQPEKIEKIIVAEFWTTEYSRDTMKPLRVYIPEDGRNVRFGGRWVPADDEHIVRPTKRKIASADELVLEVAT